MSRKSLKRRFRKSKWGSRLTGWFVTYGVRALVRSLKMEWVDRSPMDELYAAGQHFIFAYWHADLILATRVGAEELKNRPIVLMTSHSRDGVLLADLMGCQGMTIVRGSSKRGGMEGFLAFAKSLRSGMNGSLAVDGPRGPRRKVKDGVIRLAQMTSIPILPCAVGYSRYLTLNTWDRLRVPYPFTRTAAICDSPMYIDRKLSHDEAGEAARELGRRLTELRKRLPFDRD